jgi:hypothetical protein
VQFCFRPKFAEEFHLRPVEYLVGPIFKCYLSPLQNDPGLWLNVASLEQFPFLGRKNATFYHTTRKEHMDTFFVLCIVRDIELFSIKTNRSLENIKSILHIRHMDIVGVSNRHMEVSRIAPLKFG